MPVSNVLDPRNPRRIYAQRNLRNSIPHFLVTIFDNGTVEWQPAALYQTSCGIDTKFFPFDSQNCTLKEWGSRNGQLSGRRLFAEAQRSPQIKFGSWSFTAEEQLLLPTGNNETLREVIEGLSHANCY